LIFVAVIWAVFLLDQLPGVQLDHFLALKPRTLPGLVGIVTMPFLHGGWLHIISNTVPLLVLLMLLAGSRADSWQVVALVVLLGGGLTWLLGGQASHVGASGLVLGLVTFLIASGLLERRPIPLVISIVVGLLYGMSLIRGLIPFFPTGQQISWSAHWCGAAAGIGVAYMLARRGSRTERLQAAETIA
jgi:membrane associated rhomboid family serine protease